MNSPRSRHWGELGVDLAIVVGSALYVHAAGSYPPQGRQIPTVVGWLAIGLGVLHLVGHAVPRLWAVTHDSEARKRKAPDLPKQVLAATAATTATTEAAPGAPATAAAPAITPPVTLKVPPGDPRQVVVAIGWVLLLLAGVYVLGFEVAIPAFFLAYFAYQRAWRTALISAFVMWALAYGLFSTALGVPLPHGML